MKRKSEVAFPVNNLPTSVRQSLAFMRMKRSAEIKTQIEKGKCHAQYFKTFKKYIPLRKLKVYLPCQLPMLALMKTLNSSLIGEAYRYYNNEILASAISLKS